MDVTAKINWENRSAEVHTSYREKPFLISHTRKDGLYVITNNGGIPISDKLSGGYSSIPNAIEAITRYLEAAGPSKTVKANNGRASKPEGN